MTTTCASPRKRGERIEIAVHLVVGHVGVERVGRPLGAGAVRIHQRLQIVDHRLVGDTADAQLRVLLRRHADIERADADPLAPDVAADFEQAIQLGPVPQAGADDAVALISQGLLGKGGCAGEREQRDDETGCGTWMTAPAAGGRGNDGIKTPTARPGAKHLL